MDNFKIKNTFIKGLKIIIPEKFEDNRGLLMVTYNQRIIRKLLDIDFVQDKWTKSIKGVLRGIHFQEKHPQGKLVYVLKGKVLDVVVDLRINSETFGKYFKIELSGNHTEMLFIPEGLGHAVLCLEDETYFGYKTTDYFYPQFDKGILWNDKRLNINWELEKYKIKKPILSSRDMKQPLFNQYFKK